MQLNGFEQRNVDSGFMFLKFYFDISQVMEVSWEGEDQGGGFNNYVNRKWSQWFRLNDVGIEGGDMEK